MFASSPHVAELTPDDVEQGTGAPRVTRGRNGTVWVVFLYNPTCMMSRAVAPLVELAAAAARETSPDVLFGAYACGGYGETRAEGARDRYLAARIIRRRVAASDAAATTWIVRGDESSRASGSRGSRTRSATASNPVSRRARARGPARKTRPPRRRRFQRRGIVLSGTAPGTGQL